MQRKTVETRYFSNVRRVKTSVGGYFNPMPEDEDSAQFDISDRRPLDEVIKWLMELGYLPSFVQHAIEPAALGKGLWKFVKSADS